MTGKGSGRYSSNVLPRKSKLRGRLARLEIRQAAKPPDRNGQHFITPGSMNGNK